MRFRTRTGRQRSRGVSLVELLIVIVVLAIGTVAVISMSGQVFRGQVENNDFQTGAQLLQECAEHILATRRRASLGYVSVTSTSCSGLGTFSGFSAPTVSITEPFTDAACPSGATCKRVVVSVSKGTSSLTPVSLMLVNY